LRLLPLSSSGLPVDQVINGAETISMTLPLFPPAAHEELAPGAWLLRGFAGDQAAELMTDLFEVIKLAPLRHMLTASGHRMSVAMSNCGPLGWVSDKSGYRYVALDPDRGMPWPPMPTRFTAVASDAAAQADFEHFDPDACLINRYASGTKLSLHQDRDERDFHQPIVSVSLGVPAVFLFGGTRRQQRPARVTLEHGDVVVWGGPSRLNFHGVAELAPANHALTGGFRFNLTFRKAG
jgi:alkylated DNA repair protein (DNA oxidative demethylase)